MSVFEFSAPASGTVLKPAEIEGHLLVVEPAEYVPSIQTAMGESDAVRVDVHDITAQETFEGVLWFSTVLVSSLKGQVGRKVLGVMGKGVAKPGQSAPWTLVDASRDADAVKAASAYLEARAASTFAAPAPAPAAPAAAAGAASPELAAALAKFKS